MFGYDLKTIADGRAIYLASPEKALIDLLYIYPFYNSIEALEDLRLDYDFLHGDLDTGLLDEYTSRYKKRAMERRVQLMKKTYNL